MTKPVLLVSELKENVLLLKVKILLEKCIIRLHSQSQLKHQKVSQLALQSIETSLDDLETKGLLLRVFHAILGADQ